MELGVEEGEGGGRDKKGEKRNGKKMRPLTVANCLHSRSELTQQKGGGGGEEARKVKLKHHLVSS